MTRPTAIDLALTRADFPLLKRLIDGLPLTHLDSASTAPKPQCVIDAVTRFYTEHTANVHRGVHVLSEEATDAFESARQEVAALIGASPAEIVFTRNSTEGINLVAHGLGLQSEDEVVITALEHHSNFMPWRLHSRAVPVGLEADGLPRYAEIHERLSPHTRLVALAHVSNTLGVEAPVAQWIAAAHERGIPALIDASQSASHVPIDVKALDCDFLVLSGHKLLGPSGMRGLIFNDTIGAGVQTGPVATPSDIPANFVPSIRSFLQTSAQTSATAIGSPAGVARPTAAAPRVGAATATASARGAVRVGARKQVSAKRAMLSDRHRATPRA